jgi:hypothetical protein
MMFRQRSSPAIEAAQLEELRRQDARKALERECRTLRRQFTALEKEHRVLRAGQELQSQRLDSMVVQSGALLTLINGLGEADGRAGGGGGGGCASKKGFACPYVAGAEEEEGGSGFVSRQKLAVLEAENRALTDDRAHLLRRNAELELQVETVMTQFGSLLADYEDARRKLSEFKCASVSFSSAIKEEGELGGGQWERL